MAVSPVLAVATIGADLTNNAPVSNTATEVAQETTKPSAPMPASAVPVEKVVTRVADPAMDDTQPSKPELTPSAVAPAVATFNLPTLPPIPDQPKPAISDSEASEAVKVAVPTAAPMPAQPISRPPQQVTVASTDNAIDKVNESVAAPMSEACTGTAASGRVGANHRLLPCCYAGTTGSTGNFARAGSSNQ